VKNVCPKDAFYSNKNVIMFIYSITECSTYKNTFASAKSCLRLAK